MSKMIWVGLVVVSMAIFGSALLSYPNFVDWKNMGLYGGALRDVVVEPTTGAVYAGFNGGLYKTTDGGNSWIKILDGGCPAVAIDSTNKTIYASGNGLVKSADGGQTWEDIIGQDDGTYAYSTSEIIVDPSNHNIIYVGTGGSEIGVNDARIYKSTDGGESWTELSLAQNTEIWSIAVDYNDNKIIYVAEQDRIFNPDGHVWKSTDGGATWTDISPAGDGDFAAVAVDPTDSNIVYVGTAPPSGTGHLYKSTDSGNNWNSKLDAYIGDIEIDPTNTNIIYCANYKSTDGGENWTAFPDPIDPGGQVAIDPSDTSILYAGSGQGIAKSTDSGTNWFEINAGIEEVVVQDAVRSPSNANTIYLAAQEGFAKTTDNGTNWDFPIETVLHCGLSLHAVAVGSNDGSDIVYIGAEFGYLDKSADGGASWTAVGLADCPEYDYIENITLIIIHPYDTTTVFVSSAEPVYGVDGGMYKSTDGGATWSCKLQDKPVTCIATVDGQTLYAGAGDQYAGRTVGGIYKSTAGGNTWISSGLEDKVVRSIEIDTTDPNILYAGTGDGYSTTTCAIYRSTDGGNTWEDISTEALSEHMPKGSVSAMFLDADEDILYVAVSNFIFKATNASSQSIEWSYIETGFGGINTLLPGSLSAGTDKGLFKFIGTEWQDIAEDTQPSGGNGACFLATAAFGTPMAREVEILRQFRDQYLMKTVAGKNFVKLCYKSSPPISRFIENKPILRAVVRVGLKPLIWATQRMVEER